MGRQSPENVPAGAGGDSFPNSGKTFVEVVNGSGSSITVNIAAVLDGVTDASFRSVAVPAGARRIIGPFPTSPYNDSNSRVNLTYSATASVTVGAFTLP
ncbi:MAG: hypothetical protein HC828_02150 [Blastochloris sp.]|nr:hypothetical protein [Blastochloris sp.]